MVRARTTGLYCRGDIIWLRYKDANGRWRDASSGLRRGQEAEARALLEELRRQVSTRGVLGFEAGGGPLTFAAYFRVWVERRKARQIKTWTDDDSRIRTHVLDALGHKRLEEITPIDLETVFLDMRRREKAPKTVWNTYSSVRALFRDAVKQGLVARSPCILGEEELGAMVDKDPEWRDGAIYTREEIASLVFDARIPYDRRVYYAITYLAGRRLGEVSGLRFRHLEFEARPLGGMLFARSYEANRTKTKTSVRVPMHPVLAPILENWKREGFPAMFGRAPNEDDFVVPRPPGARSKFGPSRDKNYVRTQLLKDLDALGELRKRRTHDIRRSFISHVQQDGAAPHILIRLTHPSSRKATAFAGYTEFSWDDFCREVAKLQVEVPAESDVVPLSIAVGDDTAPQDPDSDPSPTSGGATGSTTSSPHRSAGARPKLAAVVAAQKEKPLENPGVSWWRRRESNPADERSMPVRCGRFRR